MFLALVHSDYSTAFESHGASQDLRAGASHLTSEFSFVVSNMYPVAKLAPPFWPCARLVFSPQIQWARLLRGIIFLGAPRLSQICLTSHSRILPPTPAATADKTIPDTLVGSLQAEFDDGDEDRLRAGDVESDEEAEDDAGRVSVTGQKDADKSTSDVVVSALDVSTGAQDGSTVTLHVSRNASTKRSANSAAAVAAEIRVYLRKNVASQRTLAARRLNDCLAVLAVLKNGSGLYRKEEVRALLYEFLVSSDSGTQKASLQSLPIFSEERTAVKPYLSQLTELIDQDRSQLRLLLQKFIVGGTNSTVRPEHVDILQPVLHRLLLAKMLHSHSKRTAKYNIKVQRSLILRYLADDDKIGGMFRGNRRDHVMNWCL